MAGLDPAIHVFVSKEGKQDVDHRDKPGDDAALRSSSITGALEYWITRWSLSPGRRRPDRVADDDGGEIIPSAQRSRIKPFPE